MGEYDTLIDELIENTKTFIVTPNSTIDLTSYGFSVKEAWEVLNSDQLEG